MCNGALRYDMTADVARQVLLYAVIDRLNEHL